MERDIHPGAALCDHHVRAVASLERYGKAAFVVELRTGARIITSRYYQAALRRLLRPEK